MAGHAVGEMQLARMVVHEPVDEMQLDVRPINALAACKGMRPPRRNSSSGGPCRAIATGNNLESRAAPCRTVMPISRRSEERYTSARSTWSTRFAPTPGSSCIKANAVPLESLRVRPTPDRSRSLRRAENARRHDHFTACVDARTAARTHDIDADGAPPIELQMRVAMPPGQHRQVRRARARDAGRQRRRCSGVHGAASPGRGPRPPVFRR